MIKFENVKKRYVDYIFDIQSMNIQQGMITGLIGKNGAGKSTAISLILGLVKPDSGYVKTFGVEARKLSAKDKKRIGVSLDNSGFCSQLSVNDIEHILAKMYVLEKYIFFIAGTIISWVEALIIYFVIMIVKNQPISFSVVGEEMFVSLIVMLLFVACMIPAHIKYGVEKSRIALIIFIGTVVVVFYCIRKIIGMDRLIKISAFLDNVNIAMLMLVGIIFVVILLFISYIISYSVMRKKEL